MNKLVIIIAFLLYVAMRLFYKVDAMAFAPLGIGLAVLIVAAARKKSKRKPCIRIG